MFSFIKNAQVPLEPKIENNQNWELLNGGYRE